MKFLKNLLNKISKPILLELKSGVTPHKLALSIAFGIIIGSIPLIGVATGLCLLAAFLFRLNHVAIQAVNYFAYPIQLALIIPFVSLGEKLFSNTATPLNLTSILNEYKISIIAASKKYFFLGLMGVGVWAIVAPFAFFIIYKISKMILNKIITKEKLSE
jgi:uncharacterized protein (DUF2062 family)